MKKIKIGIVGLGRIARTHIDAINKSNDLCELSAVVDAQEHLAQKVGNEFGVPYHTSVSKMIDSGTVDAAIVCLPHHLHLDVTLQLCKAKIHVLVEKVMATSFEEGKKMVDCAKENNVKLMVGQSRRFFKGSMIAKQMIKELGEINNILYTLACHFDKSNTPAWWASKKATGGLVYPMQGSHSIDFTLWLMQGKTPVSVYAKGTSTNDEFEGDDEVSMILTFDDGTQATNFLSINSPELKHECLILSSKGSMTFEQGIENTDLVGVEGTELIVNGKTVDSGVPEPHNFSLQMREFIMSINENRNPIASGEEILQQLKIIEAAQESSLKGQVVYL